MFRKVKSVNYCLPKIGRRGIVGKLLMGFSFEGGGGTGV
jgi:hypothetical protein